MAGGRKPEYGRLISCTLLVDGQTTESLPLASLTVSKTIYKIPYAVFEIADGGITPQDAFREEGSRKGQQKQTHFGLGQKVEIKAGYFGENGKLKEESIFEGAIVKNSIRGKGSDTFLVVECKDLTFRTTLGRKYATFYEKTEADVVKEILGQYKDCKSDITTFGVEQEYIKQYNSSDWDFIAMLADRNGQVLAADKGKISIKNIDELKAKPAIALTYNRDILDFQLRSDATRYYSELEITAYTTDGNDIQKSQQEVKPDKAYGGISQNDEHGKLGNITEKLTIPGLVTAKNLEQITKAYKAKKELALCQGSFTCMGHAGFNAGQFVEVTGFNKRFDGLYFVAGIEHTIENGEWFTALQIGTSGQWYAEEKGNVTLPGGMGITSPVQGLLTAVVKSIHEDTEGYRLKITIPTIQKENDYVWARLATFYASQEAGAFFFPEPDDEVIVGFIDDNPQYPVVLGSLYGSKKTPPRKPEETNPQKALVSRSKLKIVFDDEKKILTVETPKGKKIVLDEDADKIEIIDEHKNALTFEAGEIKLTSAKKLTLEVGSDAAINVKGKLNIKANGEIKIESSAALKVKGTNVAVDSTAQTKVNSSGITEVGGSLIKIG